MKPKLRFETIFISDVHLGAADSKAVEARHFLKNCLCKKLVLNGDIIDAWALARSGRWTKEHTQFVRTVLRKMEKEGTEVIYLRGNHDDVLERFMPLRLDNLHITHEHIHDSPHGRYLVVHGDGFDHVTTNYRWIAQLGAVGSDTLLCANRICNAYRRWRGLEAFSFSQWAKAKVKSAVSFVAKYEEQLQSLAQHRGCQGIICGHIHSPANRQVGDVHYLNSGDWVESLTAVVEHLDHRFEVITYTDFCAQTGRAPKSMYATHAHEDAEDEEEDVTGIEWAGIPAFS